jgi:hypothetical protein
VGRRISTQSFQLPISHTLTKPCINWFSNNLRTKFSSTRKQRSALLSLDFLPSKMLRNATRSYPNIYLYLILTVLLSAGIYTANNRYVPANLIRVQVKAAHLLVHSVSALRLKQIAGVRENVFKRKCRFLTQSPFASRKQAYGIKPLLSPLKASVSTNWLSQNVV